MRDNVNKKHNYSAKVQQGFAGLIVVVFICVVCICSTLAFFISDDWTSNVIGLTGKVDIEIVSRSDSASIQNTTEENKLIIYFEDEYSVLYPNALIEPTANIKVYQSTTKPLIRAIMDVKLYDGEFNEVEEGVGDLDFVLTENLYDSMATVVTSNGWVFDERDRYYYYIGSNEIATNPDSSKNIDNTVMAEVDATDSDTVVHFLDSEIRFPKQVTSAYSGLHVKFIIRFEAIQNFIPDRNGVQLPNTIFNAKKIFDNPDSYEGIV